mmetsp:Transcript_38016/g.89859  ORF Transcript_38016/g.89859 Transcript_38016/m.89859 type:complete len:296 (+) Transcript_38016:610-1497(+)
MFALVFEGGEGGEEALGEDACFQPPLLRPLDRLRLLAGHGADLADEEAAHQPDQHRRHPRADQPDEPEADVGGAVGVGPCGPPGLARACQRREHRPEHALASPATPPAVLVVDARRAVVVQALNRAGRRLTRAVGAQGAVIQVLAPPRRRTKRDPWNAGRLPKVASAPHTVRILGACGAAREGAAVLLEKLQVHAAVPSRRRHVALIAGPAVALCRVVDPLRIRGLELPLLRIALGAKQTTVPPVEVVRRTAFPLALVDHSILRLTPHQPRFVGLRLGEGRLGAARACVLVEHVV